MRTVIPEIRSSYRPTRDASDTVTLPGQHSRNVRRAAVLETGPAPPFRRLRAFLFLLGLACIGFYSYGLVDQYIVQRYENWAFDQEISGRTAVTFTDYARENLPFGSLLSAPSAEPAPTPIPEKAAPVALSEGDLVGRVSISRLGIEAIIREGVSKKTLKTSVGHIPATALPGAEGNFAIAAHRDTLFRALKDIKEGDEVTVESDSKIYTYQVVGTRIVRPSDVSVLRSDGNGLQSASIDAKTPPRLLTMITCYPFYYVGSAPKRFIVQAQLISENASS